MELLRKVNKGLPTPVLGLDKVVFGKEKDKKNAVVTWFIQNNAIGKRVGWKDDNGDINKSEPAPVFSLFPCPMSEIVNTNGEGISSIVSKNYQDVTDIYLDFKKSHEDRDVTELWNFVKGHSYASDWFGGMASNDSKESEPKEYVTDFITHALLLSKYQTMPLFYKDNIDGYDILGLIILEVVTNEEKMEEISTQEASMLNLLQRKLLIETATEYGMADLVKLLTVQKT